MKLVKESLNEFGKGVDPLKTMELGKTGEIRKFFSELGISDTEYIIGDRDIIYFSTGLDLNNSELIELPDNLMIDKHLDLVKSKIKKLPNKLIVDQNLYLMGTPIHELPEDLIVRGHIYISVYQKKLEKWMENRLKFSKKLRHWTGEF